MAANNHIFLFGRLTKDPEVRKTQNDKSVVSFSIAVKKQFKTSDGADSDFFDIVAWGARGETIAKYFKKGSRIALTGTLSVDKYTAKDGTARTSVKVQLDDFSFIDQKSDGIADQPKKTAKPAPKKEEEEIDINEDDLPF